MPEGEQAVERRCTWLVPFTDYGYHTTRPCGADIEEGSCRFALQINPVKRTVRRCEGKRSAHGRGWKDWSHLYDGYVCTADHEQEAPE